VVGDRRAGSEAQDAVEPAVRHAGGATGIEATVTWLDTASVAGDPGGRLDSFDAVWGAPGSPFLSLEGALAGIRWAREGGRPFLGTCAGFQHAVVEFARNVLGVDAGHAEYGGGGDLFIDELLCSLAGQTMGVRLVDPELQAVFGEGEVSERYYCRFGLNPAYRGELERAGLVVAGVDTSDGDVRIMRLAAHPFFVLTLFVPQTSSTEGRPHPLIVAFLRAVAAARTSVKRRPGPQAVRGPRTAPAGQRGPGR
jgi:CTP synthase (UTP-ammonia lyase)